MLLGTRGQTAVVSQVRHRDCSGLCGWPSAAHDAVDVVCVASSRAMIKRGIRRREAQSIAQLVGTAQRPSEPTFSALLGYPGGREPSRNKMDEFGGEDGKVDLLARGELN